MRDAPMDESPHKKARLAGSPADSGPLDFTINPLMLQNTADMESAIQLQQKEEDVGIKRYVESGAPVFGGLVKSRYSDFMVNEISPDGHVYHLDDLRAPKKERKGEAAHTKAQEPAAPQNPSKKPDSSQPAQDPSPQTANLLAAWHNMEEANSSRFGISPENQAELASVAGEEMTNLLTSLYNKVLSNPGRSPDHYGKVRSPQPFSDRLVRTKLHGLIRDFFRDRLESFTEADGTFVVQAKRQGGRARTNNVAPGQPAQRPGQRSDRSKQQDRKERFAALGGDYLHFSLYKENKDTMDVVSFLGSKLKLPPKSFQFAGTKDRRAVTVQRISIWRVFPEHLHNVNSQLIQSSIGNFKYERHGLELGALAGNEFVITLRDCKFPGIDPGSADAVKKASRIVGDAMTRLVNRGFINYFGLQRFGTFSTRTNTVGMLMLQGNYEGAVDAILTFEPAALAAAADTDDTAFSRDDKQRAVGINAWRETGQYSDEKRVPRKFTAEYCLMRNMLGKGPKNYLTAFLSIPRNLRHMYLHAYQSFIWNLAASHRWAKSADHLLAGDLVLVAEHRDKKPTSAKAEGEVDQDGEVVIQPGAEDRAVAEEDRFERARALTQAEVDSGRYTAFDVVLPLPGFDVEYPSHMTKFYEDVMKENGGLSPFHMRRDVKDLNLSGGYRKLLARPGKKHDWKVAKYTRDTEQFAPTDLELLQQREQHKEKAGKQSSPERKDGKAGAESFGFGLDGASESKPKETSPAPESPKEAAEIATQPRGPPNPGSESPGEVKGESPSGTGPAMEAKANAPSPTSSSSGGKPAKLAVVITLQLGSSTYATMALRELARGGIVQFKAEFGGGR